MGKQESSIEEDGPVRDLECGLGDAVERLPGIGPKRAALLANLGIRHIRDLLFHVPRDYQDRRCITPISEVEEGQTVTIEGESVRARNVRMRRGMSLAEVVFRDGTGEIKATWFGRGFLARAFPQGTRALLTGTAGTYKGLALKNPDYELLKGDDEDVLNTGRIVPIYRLTEGVTQRAMRRWVRAALDALGDELEETLPETLRAQYGFPAIREAIGCVHFPDELDETKKAQARFAYEELLAIQLAVLGSRARRHNEELGHEHCADGAMCEALRKSMPFELTQAQKRAVADLLEDLASKRPMVRLIQGDVGCGKTVVAAHAIAAVADGGFQTALMAPTEILAEQHCVTLRGLLEPLGLSVVLLTGATRQGAQARKAIESGEGHLIVGTHALIQEKVQFHRLGLAIVDEQHRFGVLQRARLSEKGLHPDILHLTATPIPRTLAMTVYGSMDITVIDELPPGRRPVITQRILPSKLPKLYAHIAEQAAQGLQTFFICPLIEESDTRDLRAVTTHFEELSTGPLSSLRVALLHGRLDTAEKDGIIQQFKDGAIDVLFSTTVVEVGIDVPTASTMVIEDAPQFGLTQLHQLRGRVGRGKEQSYCFLLGKPKTEDGKRRLDILCSTTDGFEIADEDLKLRGPGEFYGVRQAGLTDLRVADLIRDVRLLDQARRDASDILSKDPRLASSQWRALAAASKRFERLSA